MRQAKSESTAIRELNCEFNSTNSPPNSTKKNAGRRVTIRITEDEFNQLVTDSNGTSHSAHIRRCMFGNKTSKRVVPEADRLLLAQILAKLGESRIANNLNQIAYHANCGSLVLEDVTIEEINEACLHVAWMRTQLIKALGLKDRERKTS